MSNKGVKISLDSDKEQHKQIFRIIWDAYRLSYGKFAKGYNGVQIANRIKRKLHAISYDASSEKDASARELKDNGKMSIMLQREEHDMLKKMVENEDIPWTFSAGDDIESAMELIRNPTEIEIEEKEAEKEESDDDNN